MNLLLLFFLLPLFSRAHGIEVLEDDAIKDPIQLRRAIETAMSEIKEASPESRVALLKRYATAMQKRSNALAFEERTIIAEKLVGVMSEMVDRPTDEMESAAEFCAKIARIYERSFNDVVLTASWNRREVLFRRKLCALPKASRDQHIRLGEAIVDLRARLALAGGKIQESLKLRQETIDLISETKSQRLRIAHLDNDAFIFSRFGLTGLSIATYRELLTVPGIDRERSVRSLLNIGELLRMSSKFTEALVALDDARAKLAGLSDDGRANLGARCHRLIALVYRDTQRPSDSAAELSKASNLLSKLSKPDAQRILKLRLLQCDALVNAGRPYEAQSLLDASERFVSNAVGVSTPLGVALRMRYLINRQGGLLDAKIGLFDAARSRLEKALMIHREIHSHEEYLSGGMETAEALNFGFQSPLRLEEFELYAIEADEILNRRTKEGETIRGRSIVKFAEIAIIKGDMERALSLCQELLEIAKRSGNELKIRQARANLVFLRPLVSIDQLDQIRKTDEWFLPELAFDGRLASLASSMYAIGKTEVSNRIMNASLCLEYDRIASGDSLMPHFVGVKYRVPSTALRVLRDDESAKRLIANSLWLTSCETLLTEARRHGRLAAITIPAETRIRQRRTIVSNALSGAKQTEFGFSIAIDAIQKRLTPTDVLAQYASYDPGEGVNHVCLLLVTQDDVTRHELGPKWRLSEAALSFGSRIRTGRSDVDAAKRLGKLCGLEHLKLSKRRRVFIAASPLVESIPFAALIDGEGKRVIERAAVIGTSALAFQVNLPPAGQASDKLLVVGDVDYGEKQKDGLFRVSWNPLKATKVELQAIQDSAAKEQLALQVLRGRSATKKELLAAVKGARVIHLATHAAVFRSGVNEWQPVIEPFKLTGVVLANANQQGPRAVLSGAEACLLDLSGADLVVLAGCETHLGVEFADSTTASLAQAFHVAGARNVVASLWNVDDQATAAFMRLMYHNFWREGQPIHEALRNAQLDLYRHPELIPSLANSRGPDFARTRKQTKAAPQTDRRTPSRLWAAFQLSGIGGL